MMTGWPPDRWPRAAAHRDSHPALDHSRHLRLDRRAIGPEAFCGGVAAGTVADGALYGCRGRHRFRLSTLLRHASSGHLYANGSRPWRNRGNSSCCSSSRSEASTPVSQSDRGRGGWRVRQHRARCHRRPFDLGRRCGIDRDIDPDKLHVVRDHHRRQPVFIVMVQTQFPTMLAERAGA